MKKKKKRNLIKKNALLKPCQVLAPKKILNVNGKFTVCNGCLAVLKELRETHRYASTLEVKVIVE